MAGEVEAPDLDALEADAPAVDALEAGTDARADAGVGLPRRLRLSADPAAAWREEAASGAFDQVWSPAAAGPVADLAADLAVSVQPARHGSLAAFAARLAPPEADELDARRALLRAAGEVFGAEEAGGYAAVGAGAVRQILRLADEEQPFPLQDDPRTARWWTMAQRYRQILGREGKADPADRVRLAARALEVAGAEVAGRRPIPAGRLAVVGYLDLGPDEVALVDAAAGPGSLVLLPSAPGWTEANLPAVEALRARGWQLEQQAEAASAPEVPTEAVGLPTLQAEARWVVGRAKALLAEGVAAQDLLLTARDPADYADALRLAAQEAGLPLRIDRRLPLERLRGGGAMAAWLAAVAEEGAFEATLAFLAHPLVGRLSADDVARLRRWRPADPRAWARGLDDQGLLAVLDWPRRDSPAGWQRRLAGAWWGLGLLPAGLREPGMQEPGSQDPSPPPSLHPEQHPELGANAELMAAWSDALAQIPTLASAEGRVPRPAVLRLLREALRYTTVPDRWGEEHAAPVWLRSLETVAASALRPAPGPAAPGPASPHTFLLGAVEGWFPRAVQDDPALGAFERARLAAAGWPFASAGQLARRELLLAWGLRSATVGRLVISVPAQTGNDARLPSALLARWGLAPREPAATPPSTPQAFRIAALRAATVPDGVDPVLAHARSAYAQLRRRELSPHWGPDDGFAGLPVDPEQRTWSASQLMSLAGCRFRWWLQQVWGLRAPEEGATELTPLLKGRLYHATLERALRPAVGLDGERARAVALVGLEEAFAEAERLDRLDQVVPSWPRWREEHLASLRGLLQSEDFLPPERVLLEIESDFHGVWRGWRVQGRVDRIDMGPDGLQLIDLKLGSSSGALARDAELEPRLDLQLPLYREVAAPFLHPRAPLAGASYFSLSKVAEIRSKPPEEADLEDLFARLRASLRAGFFPVEPHPEVCRRCDLELVCRKGPPPHAHLLRKPPPYRVPEPP